MAPSGDVGAGGGPALALPVVAPEGGDPALPVWGDVGAGEALALSPTSPPAARSGWLACSSLISLRPSRCSGPDGAGCSSTAFGPREDKALGASVATRPSLGASVAPWPSIGRGSDPSVEGGSEVRSADAPTASCPGEGAAASLGRAPVCSGEMFVGESSSRAASRGLPFGSTTSASRSAGLPKRLLDRRVSKIERARSGPGSASVIGHHHLRLAVGNARTLVSRET